MLTETLPGGVTRSYQYTAGLLAEYAETRGQPGRRTDLGEPIATMRLQVQWTPLRGGRDVDFSTVVNAPAGTGVTPSQAVAALEDVVLQVRPNGVASSSRFKDAFWRAVRYIESAPPGGIIGKTSESFYFALAGAAAARIDVETLLVGT